MVLEIDFEKKVILIKENGPVMDLMNIIKEHNLSDFVLCTKLDDKKERRQLLYGNIREEFL